jgi:hypothetical protein
MNDKLKDLYRGALSEYMSCAIKQVANAEGIMVYMFLRTINYRFCVKPIIIQLKSLKKGK